MPRLPLIPWLAAALLCASWNAASGASYNSGIELLKQCRAAIESYGSPEIADVADAVVVKSLLCAEKIRAVVAAHELLPVTEPQWCMAEDENANEQAAQRVVKYLELYPEYQNRNDIFLIVQALQWAYPCD